MRKITEDAIRAFNNNEDFKRANTEVWNDKEVGVTYLVLHGNTIAKKTHGGKLFISTCGWETSTTKDRLNGLPGVSIHQKNYQWYLNGKEWNGGLIEVK